MDGREILDYYRTRFQLEFCFRDGKQHAGITNSQSTDFRKLDFHFNASLAAVNLAKAACKRLGIAIPYPLASHSYTMRICLNDLFACLGLAQTRKLLTNFSKNSFYLLPEQLRLGEFLTNYCYYILAGKKNPDILFFYLLFILSFLQRPFAFTVWQFLIFSCATASLRKTK